MQPQYTFCLSKAKLELVTLQGNKDCMVWWITYALILGTVQALVLQRPTK